MSPLIFSKRNINGSVIYNFGRFGNIITLVIGCALTDSYTGFPKIPIEDTLYKYLIKYILENYKNEIKIVKQDLGINSKNSFKIVKTFFRNTSGINEWLKENGAYNLDIGTENFIPSYAINSDSSDEYELKKIEDFIEIYRDLKMSDPLMFIIKRTLNLMEGKHFYTSNHQLYLKQKEVLKAIITPYGRHQSFGIYDRNTNPYNNKKNKCC